MRLCLFSIVILLAFSCKEESKFTPGNYYVYDLLDDTSFYATEHFNPDGSGVFKEMLVHESDTCVQSIIQFKWVFLHNRLIYKDQVHTAVEHCDKILEPENMEDQFYTLLDKGKNYFTGKLYYHSDIAKPDSSVLLWKKRIK